MKVKKSKRHEPEWFANRIAMAFQPRGGDGYAVNVGFDESWQMMLTEFGTRWYDHHATYTIDDEDIFTAEPELSEAQVENVKRMACKIGCCLDIWPQPNRCVRLIFSRFGWADCDPLATSIV